MALFIPKKAYILIMPVVYSSSSTGKAFAGDIKLINTVAALSFVSTSAICSLFL